MIGFFGAGNMASALIEGMLKGGARPCEIAVWDLNGARLEAFEKRGLVSAASEGDLAQKADILVIAIKPKDCCKVLETLKALSFAGILVSIVAGWTQTSLEAALPGARGIVRAMPNTPAQIGEGVTSLNANHSANPADFKKVERLFSYCGRTVVVPETLFDAVTGVSGSGPAYAYMFIEALADAGVRHGLARDTAYTLAAQTLRGAATMVLETGTHPGALKDAVCSPGGTTIEAVYALEKAGFRGAVLGGVDACVKKAGAITK